VLEFCGGRGNKTVQLAGRAGATSPIVTIEIDERKARTLQAQLANAGADVAVVVGDARFAAPDVLADAILLDAPCSGTGIIGRHPEARWRKRPDDGARLAELQAELLRAAATHAAPGGRITYSVCSSDAREGRGVVDAFLAGDPRFSRLPLPDRYDSLNRDGDVVVPAGVDGRDGFYIASLGRT
jgi:16S rRNA (cytosine967-C5)-methyltransferase